MTSPSEGAAWHPEVWDSDEVLSELRSWAAARIGTVQSMSRVKDRPWAAVWRMSADSGVYYLKQNCPAQQQEARIVDVLSRVEPTRVEPTRVVSPVALDVGRDLLLTADQGPTFREVAENTDAGWWERLVREAMLLARSASAHLDELDLTVIAPAASHDYAERARAQWRIPDELRDEVDRAVVQTARDGEELAALGLPLTMNHNDLHDANAFVTADRVRFFDFGDAVTTSPLCALRLPLAACANVLGTGFGDSRVEAVVEAALDVWSDIAPLNELRAALPAAWRLAALGRAESWHRVVTSIPEDYPGANYPGTDYLDADAAWLAKAAGPAPWANARG